MAQIRMPSRNRARSGIGRGRISQLRVARKRRDRTRCAPDVEFEPGPFSDRHRQRQRHGGGSDHQRRTKQPRNACRHNGGHIGESACGEIRRQVVRIGRRGIPSPRRRAHERYAGIASPLRERSFVARMRDADGCGTLADQNQRRGDAWDQ